jgi:hypothetical protein
MRLLVATLALAGCSKVNPDFCPSHPDDPRCGGTLIDSGMGSDSGGSDAVDSGNGCLGAGVFEICPMGAAMTAKTLSGAIDTNGSMCHSTQLWKTSGQTPSCFIVGTSITVSNVTVTGSRPLVLVATGTITVTGHLDASSRQNPTQTGPGQPATPCGTFGAPGDDTGAGGGGGASLAATGAGGGNGGSGNAGAAAAGTAYMPFLTVPPGLLRAGCTGSRGGDGQGIGGTGGRGGGAVYLAASTISLGAAAVVNVSGAGAAAPGKSAGGGGGGSGGMLLLHAADFSITAGAKLVANGGAGSSGGDGNNAGNGNPGGDPDPLNPMTQAAGGQNPGGKGGDGYALGMPAENGANGVSSTAGGGGGGAGGYIQSNQMLTNATVSPPANVVL